MLKFFIYRVFRTASLIAAFLFLIDSKAFSSNHVRHCLVVENFLNEGEVISLNLSSSICNQGDASICWLYSLKSGLTSFLKNHGVLKSYEELSVEYYFLRALLDNDKLLIQALNQPGEYHDYRKLISGYGNITEAELNRVYHQLDELFESLNQKNIFLDRSRNIQEMNQKIEKARQMSFRIVPMLDEIVKNSLNHRMSFNFKLEEILKAYSREAVTFNTNMTNKLSGFLKQGEPVIAHFENFSALPFTNQHLRIVSGSQFVGRHDVLLVGEAKISGSTFFIFQNSWGVGFKYHGVESASGYGLINANDLGALNFRANRIVITNE